MVRSSLLVIVLLLGGGTAAARPHVLAHGLKAQLIATDGERISSPPTESGSI